jgi:hypothetical protein
MSQPGLKRLALLLVGLLLVVLALIAGQLVRRSAAACAPTRVLFVGNSYIYEQDMPAMLTRLGESASPKQCIETAMVVQGGATLAELWNGGAARDAIRSGDWDFVVLQEQSMTPILDQAAMAGAVRAFSREITASGAQTVLFLTWARQYSPQSQAQISAAYLALGRELGVLVAPVGVAWARAGQLDPSIGLYAADQSHPAPAGAYLTASVFYATLFGRSPAGLDDLGIVPAEQARTLHEAAWWAVSQRR